MLFTSCVVRMRENQTIFDWKRDWVSFQACITDRNMKLIRLDNLTLGSHFTWRSVGGLATFGMACFFVHCSAVLLNSCLWYLYCSDYKVILKTDDTIQIMTTWENVMLFCILSKWSKNFEIIFSFFNSRELRGLISGS